MKRSNSEGFAWFFLHVVEADPALYKGILCYAGILAILAVIRLAVDSTGAWLMGMVRSHSSGEEEVAEAVAVVKVEPPQHGQDAGMQQEVMLLACLVLLELVQDVLRKHMFVLLNKFVRDPFHIAGVRYALKAIHDSSPHWISGMNPSMLRKHVEEGLGAYRAVLARLSYIAPVALVATTSLASLGLWFSPKYTLIIVLGWSAFYFTHGAKITTEISEGDRAVQTNRNKFSHMLELEFGRFGQIATRGEDEFAGFAQRLSAYESFFPLASAPFRWRSSRLQSTQVLLLHSLAAVVLVLFVNERFHTGSRAERLGQFVYLYNLLQRCLQSMQTLLEHKHYFMNESSPHVNLERLLEERIPRAPSTPQNIQTQAIALVSEPFEITIKHMAVCANFDSNHHFRLLIERPITVAAGDVVFIAGANGVGKSTLLKVLAGELQSRSRDSVGYSVESTASLRNEATTQMEFEFANDHMHAHDGQLLDVFKCLRDAGVIAELPQGELRDIRRTRIGDVFWRMNGLLANAIADDFDLSVAPNVQRSMVDLVVDCLRAVDLDGRLHVGKLLSDELMATVISDMSGGEIQRLRLAAFFYMEIVRWRVHDECLPANLLLHLQREPARTILLDEPDRSLDTVGANKTVANLLRLFGDRQANILLFVVLHSEVQPELWAVRSARNSSRLFTLAVGRDCSREATSVVTVNAATNAGAPR